MLNASDILVGYNLQEFVAADGKLCAALLEREFDAKTIRVLLMDTGFKSVFHASADLVLGSAWRQARSLRLALTALIWSMGV